MAIEDDVHVCAVLRNFKSSKDYLHFGDFWVQKLTDEDKTDLTKNLREFSDFPWSEVHLACKWYYIGRGKSTTVLRDNSMMFFSPLFRAMKLFNRGDLIIPLLFYRWKGKWHEMKFHGDSYGLGSWIHREDEPYILEEHDIEPFNIFREQIKEYLKYIDFPIMPYCKKHNILEDIDTRCFLPVHILLKGSVEHHNLYPVVDALIDYTLALESLYVLRNEDIRRNLSSRLALLIAQHDTEESNLNRNIKKFYDIRSTIVHGSLMREKDYDFICNNIYDYRDYLRKSILAFLDLNKQYKTKRHVLKRLDHVVTNSRWSTFWFSLSGMFAGCKDLKKETRNSLAIFNLAKL